jgi:hypothetical protein
MYLTYVLIIIFLIILVIIGTVILSKGKTTTENQTINYVNSDIKIVRDVIINDSYLHRLLMIEIIKETNYLNYPTSESIDLSLYSNTNDSYVSVENHSDRFDKLSLPENITFSKMTQGNELLCKALSRSFGGVISKKIATLSQKRNTIIRDYYCTMRNNICVNGSCDHLADIPSRIINYKSTRHYEVDSINTSSSADVDTEDLNDTNVSMSSTPRKYAKTINPYEIHGHKTNKCDPTALVLEQLEIIAQNMVDAVATAFHIIDIDKLVVSDDSISKIDKDMLVHYERLFNLMVMYDREIINQGRSYAASKYDTSMNCSKSAIDLSRYIGYEFAFLMRNRHQE